MLFIFSDLLHSVWQSLGPSTLGHMHSFSLFFFFTAVCVSVAQSCLTLCDPVDCSPPGFSVHRILQARMLEWVAISFSRGSSQPRDKTRVFLIAGRLFSIWATREAFYGWVIFSCIYVERMAISSNAFPVFIEMIMWFFCLLRELLMWCSGKKKKNPPGNAGISGSVGPIPRLGRSPREGNGYPL